MADSEEDASGGETKGQMQKRHKAEQQELKKKVQRLGKKGKEEAHRLQAELDARHAAEAAALEAGGGAAPSTNPTADADAADADAAAEDLAAVSLAQQEPAAPQGGGKASKAAKRRAKKEAEEREREKEIAEYHATRGESEREAEEKQLLQLLTPLGLKPREIKADGHCLYRSLEDQLAVANGGDTPAGLDYLGLRKKAAERLRAERDDYMPFIDGCFDEGGEERFEQYCHNVEATATWGGHLELRVLSTVLERGIKVFSTAMPTTVVGEEFVTDDVPPLQVCYQRHAFGLGEHYNSVAPLLG